jgi:hypothetical protein
MKLMSMMLLAALTLSVQETRKADEAFKDALAKAKETKKKVFLTFGSPG